MSCSKLISDTICIDDIADVADVAEIHPNYAITIFKPTCGINIVALITMLKIYESQRLLLTTDRKILDIAMDCGFSSMNNFYKSFHWLCGKRPHEYRHLSDPMRTPAVLSHHP